MKTELIAEFFVHGDPTAQPRQRHAERKGKDGRVYVQNYTPKDAPVQDWKAIVKLTAAMHLRAFPLIGPLRVSITWYFKRPKKHFVACDPARELKADADVFVMKTPDRDNLDKAVLDSLTSIGFWDDDKQVVSGELMKKYANPGEHPGANIKVERYL